MSPGGALTLKWADGWTGQKREGDEKLIEPLLAIEAQIQILWPRAAVTLKTLADRRGRPREEVEDIICLPLVKSRQWIGLSLTLLLSSRPVLNNAETCN